MSKNNLNLLIKRLRYKYADVTGPILNVLSSKLGYFKAISTQGHVTKTVLFYPEKPKNIHLLYKICHRLGYRMTNDLNAHADLTINFADITTRTPSPQLVKKSESQRVININCNDISKKHVDRVFNQVFGYSLSVDPSVFQSQCVMKSIVNGTHSGKIVNCPIEAQPGYVYQRVVNNQSGSLVMDMRIPFIDGKIPFIYKKFRDVEERFESRNIAATISTPTDAFSEEELTKIKQFAKMMGLDYGEMDILRDRDSKLIYIVDVNNTPAGPPNHLNKYLTGFALETITNLFRSSFIF